MVEPTIKLLHASKYTSCYEVSIIGKTVHTLVTKDACAVVSWIEEVKSVKETGGAARIVGLDMEWSSSSEDKSWNRVGIIQLCVGTQCLIYQIYQAFKHVPVAIDDFLSDWDNMFVGLHVGTNLDKLFEEYKIGNGARCLDLGRAAANRFWKPDLTDVLIENLANMVLGTCVENPRTEVFDCEWEKSRLREVEVLYATVGAFLAYEIGIIFISS